MSGFQIFNDGVFNNTRTSNTVNLPIFDQTQLTPVNKIGRYSQEGNLVYGREPTTVHDGNINYFDGRRWIPLAARSSTLFSGDALTARMEFFGNTSVITQIVLEGIPIDNNELPIALVRTGNVITLNFENFVVQALSGPYIPTDGLILLGPDNLLPSIYRPMSNLELPIVGENPHGTKIAALLIVNTNGTLVVAPMSGNWVGIGSGTKGVSVTYTAKAFEP